MEYFQRIFMVTMGPSYWSYFEYSIFKTAKIHEIITLLFPLLLTSTCLHGYTSFPFHLFIWILAFYKYRQEKFENFVPWYSL